MGRAVPATTAILSIALPKFTAELMTHNLEPPSRRKTIEGLLVNLKF